MYHIELEKNSRVYIMVPAYFATGGPELLHQLGFHLREMGICAKMYYMPNSHPTPIYPEYEKYSIDFVRKIVDDKKNVLIIPEVYTKYVYRYKNIRKVIWWLSVDNYYVSTHFKGKRGLIKKVLHLLGYKFYFEFRDNSKVYIHLVQSEYARHSLLKKNIKNIAFLSDYINKEFFNNLGKKNISKEDIVAFNPRKGYDFTKKIIDQAVDIKFVPIENMRRSEVINLLKKSKIYIDFGNHPGKDRIPREAAICGCCVIVGRKGSASFFKDVPILEEFKFNLDNKEIPKIVKKFKECLTNFNEQSSKFSSYREIIKNEKKMFLEDLKKYFVVHEI